MTHRLTSLQKSLLIYLFVPNGSTDGISASSSILYLVIWCPGSLGKEFLGTQTIIVSIVFWLWQFMTSSFWWVGVLCAHITSWERFQQQHFQNLSGGCGVVHMIENPLAGSKGLFCNRVGGKYSPLVISLAFLIQNQYSLVWRSKKRRNKRRPSRRSYDLST